MKRGLSDRPLDYAAVVAKHWPDSTAYLQVSREPCITIRDDEVKKIGGNRNLIALAPGDFEGIDQNRIWILGVILCPGDDVAPVVEWVQQHQVDPDRIWFFLHEDTDMGILQPWADAGYPTMQVDFVTSWSELHPVFGLYLSDAIYDAKGPRHKRTWTLGRKPKPPSN